ncbi:hypothetical protein AOR13_66 [Alteromonas stellipolaris LMG 21856]|nr:hypothetical protein AOR13_66 [Alteromonas stellipolaris LMG 21856]
MQTYRKIIFCLLVNFDNLTSELHVHKELFPTHENFISHEPDIFAAGNL